MYISCFIQFIYINTLNASWLLSIWLSVTIVELFAESAVRSDDDDMIGYDVGLGPHSLAPAVAGAAVSR